jgi:hypothetical protein
MAGVSAVLAGLAVRSFRNAINRITVLICDTTAINDGDELE